jgi:hypothetical protein
MPTDRNVKRIFNPETPDPSRHEQTRQQQRHHANLSPPSVEEFSHGSIQLRGDGFRGLLWRRLAGLGEEL